MLSLSTVLPKIARAAPKTQVSWVTERPVVQTIKLLANLVQREALVLTYNDAIMLLGGLFVAALLVMPLVRRPRATPVSPGH